MIAKIIKIVDETKDIKSFRLQPEQEMRYIPGQWMFVRLNENLKHHFTISSSPTEPHLQFTTVFREESDYKKALWTKKIDDEVEIAGPNGGFIFDESDKTSRLFIAGGIGITPFRSMIRYAVDKNLSVPITLLYSVKTKDQAAFANLPYTRLIYPNNSSLHAQTDLGIYPSASFAVANLAMMIIETEKDGRLDEEKVKRLCPDWQDRSWWLCGPPALVAAFVELGKKMGISPEKLKSEDFTGY